LKSFSPPAQTIGRQRARSDFEALVDTGTGYCLFDARIGASIRIKVNNGPEGDLGGIVPGAKSAVYFHDVKLVVATEMVQIKAGFFLGYNIEPSRSGRLFRSLHRDVRLDAKPSDFRTAED
jgi:hypothetical protein